MKTLKYIDIFVSPLSQEISIEVLANPDHTDSYDIQHDQIVTCICHYFMLTLLANYCNKMLKYPY